MKAIRAIFAVSVALLWVGCGNDDAATTSRETAATTAAESGSEPPAPAAASDPSRTVFPNVLPSDDPRFASVTYGEGRYPKPQIDPADGPQPRKLLVRDLEVGSGPVARAGDEVGVFYIGVAHATGKKQFQTWPPTAQPFVTELRSFESAEGWEKGVMGMREGGRREVLVPSRLAFDSGALDYVFVLASLKPASEAPPGG